jgi:hypothetical protein
MAAVTAVMGVGIRRIVRVRMRVGSVVVIVVRHGASAVP